MPMRGTRLMYHFSTMRFGEHEWLMNRAMFPPRRVDDLGAVQRHEVHVLETAQLALALLSRLAVDDLAHVLDHESPSQVRLVLTPHPCRPS